MDGCHGEYKFICILCMYNTRWSGMVHNMDMRLDTLAGYGVVYYIQPNKSAEMLALPLSFQILACALGITNAPSAMLDYCLPTMESLAAGFRAASSNTSTTRAL